MKKIIITMFVLFFVAACSIIINTGSLLPSHKTFDVTQAHKSVAEVYFIKIDNNKQIGLSGTAFAVDRDYLMTAGHVCSEIQKRRTSDKELIHLGAVFDGLKVDMGGVKIVLIDVKSDMCVLKKSGHGLFQLEFVDDYDKDVKFGEKEWVVGAPLGFMVSWLEGTIMDTDRQERDINTMVISSPIASGNSGSPVINEFGKVIGMVVRGTKEYDHIGICVKSTDLKRFLEIARIF